MGKPFAAKRNPALANQSPGWRGGAPGALATSAPLIRGQETCDSGPALVVVAVTTPHLDLVTRLQASNVMSLQWSPLLPAAVLLPT